MRHFGAVLLVVLVFPAAASARVVVVADGDDVTLFDRATSKWLAKVKVEGGPTARRWRLLMEPARS